MKYCKHLKKRKNKPYCNILKKEITLSQCQECVNKEYRFPVKGKIVKSNSNQIRKSPVIKKKSPVKSGNCIVLSNKCAKCNNLNSKITKNVQKMKIKSKKQAKLEKNRYSVFTNNMNKCYFCDNPKMDKHEIYRGRNRNNSMKYGFVLPICRYHHDLYQEDSVFNDYWHKIAQQYFEEHYGTREDFIKIFRRSYL